jgi:hypothetical protein
MKIVTTFRKQRNRLFDESNGNIDFLNSMLQMERQGAQN